MKRCAFLILCRKMEKMKEKRMCIVYISEQEYKLFHSTDRLHTIT